MPAWLPSQREFRGLGLALTLALVALFLVRTVFRGSPWAPDIVVAIGLGALVLNSRVARWIGLNVAGGREGDPYERGLRFTGKWVLRLAIILMGLKVRTDILEAQLLLQVLLVLLFTLPATFFVAHTVAGLLGLRREMADLVAIGTMVCGASAINALAPTVFAHRRDQGLAVTSIFLFSVVALLTFLPLGTALGLDTESAGLWAGVAVNDLSSSVAVGSQFGEQESLIATMAKATRILLLGPLLIGFSLLRRRAPVEGRVRLRLAAHLPLFVVGYFLLFGLRLLGDSFFLTEGTPSEVAWTAVLDANDLVVNIAIVTVCATIGLQIHIRTLLEVGWRTAVAAGAAWGTLAALSLGMLFAFLHDATVIGLTAGFGTVGLGFVLFRRWAPRPISLRARLDGGEPLSVREMVELFDLLDRDGALDAGVARRALARVEPAIGELVPLRQSTIQGGINYRRLTFWRSAQQGSSLVGILWTPGTTAHIHSHDYSAVCRRIEGTVEITEFERAAEESLRVVRRSRLGASSMTEFSEAETIHVVRNAGAHDAIDLHYCEPRGSRRAERFIPRDANAPLAPGEKLAVDVVDDSLPVVEAELGA